jgi:hypothetical protein
MIAHIVLFRPRRDVTPAERTVAVAALRRAVREIPSIRRMRIGRRVTHGRPYEQLMGVDYSMAAMFEFDDLEGLQAYLNHSVHDQLASNFFAVFEEALMYDFELADGEAAVQGFAEEPR